MKGILMLFEDTTAGGLAYARDTEINQIYSQGMRSYHTWEEAKKLSSRSPTNKRDPEVAAAEMQLALSDVTLPSFLATKFCAWLDLPSNEVLRMAGLT